MDIFVITAPSPRFASLALLTAADRHTPHTLGHFVNQRL
jgi:hypothetical protein